MYEGWIVWKRYVFYKGRVTRATFSLTCRTIMLHFKLESVVARIILRVASSGNMHVARSRHEFSLVQHVASTCYKAGNMRNNVFQFAIYCATNSKKMLPVHFLMGYVGKMFTTSFQYLSFLSALYLWSDNFWMRFPLKSHQAPHFIKNWKVPYVKKFEIIFALCTLLSQKRLAKGNFT